MGEAAVAALFLGLLAALMIIMFAIVFVADPDFYEHVAGATQTAFETTRAVAEGDIQSVYGLSNQKARVKGTGINGGDGASTFLFKHIRESFRARRLGLWGIPTLLYIVGAGIFAFISRTGSYNEYGHYAVPELVVVTILSVMLLFGFFSMSMSRGSLEIYSHYIYLIPENPFKKWLWANAEMVLKVTVDAILVFGVAGLITWRSPLNFALAAVVYVTFAFYGLGTTLAFLRLTGIASRSAILSVLMLIIYILPLLPGLLVAIIVGILTGNLAVGLFILAAWQTGIGLVCFAMSKSMLHNCDMLSIPRELEAQFK
jgi:hypothetical protein